MIHHIERHIDLINSSIDWAHKYNKASFPYELFKDYRRKLRRIHEAMEENCSAAAYGESQVGKSYLMSSLLSSPEAPFVITNNGKSYSFIDDINPSGGNNAKIESTGVITRFTLSKGESAIPDAVKVRNLSVVDIILLLTDSYYNDIKINPDSVLRYDDINMALEGLSSLWSFKETRQREIGEDDIKDISGYLHDVIGNVASGVNQSNFCKVIAPVIQYVPYEHWVDIFSLLWNKNREISHLFSTLIAAYKKIDFQTDIYVPFSAVLRDKGTLLKIEWLDTVCGVQLNTGQDEIYTDVYDKQGRMLVHDFHKGDLSALIAELTFELPHSVAADKVFLHKMDLLDFPGARSREKYKEQEIHTVLPKILRRGKVAYLFNKYSRSLRISSVLFCHHNDQKAEATIGDTINSWIDDNIGSTPEERAAMLNHTKGIAPLFFIATKFNIDLEKTKTDSPSSKDKLDLHWNRFDTVIPEIIKPNKWLEEWVPRGGAFKSESFQNIYPLRDFYWSGKNRVFDGFSDGAIKSEEKAVHVHPDYPNYFDDLRESFLRNKFVRRHFADPEKTWDDVATLNNDGSKAIIKNLNSIAGVLDDARRKKYLAEAERIKAEMLTALRVYYEPEDKEAKNQKVKQIAGDIRMSLIFGVGEKPEIFGRIIDALMVPVGDLRSIAYDIIICHSDAPRDFSMVTFIRKQAGIDPSDNERDNVEKLCDFFGCNEESLKQALRERNCTLSEVVSSETEALTTIGDVVAKHIVEYWNTYISNQAKSLEPILPHADEVVFMLSSLLKKMDIKCLLADRINFYDSLFSPSEQPNAIADFAALTLNNFVSSVGRKYISDDDVESIRAKAEQCEIRIDLSPSSFDTARKPQPLLQTLKAFDDASNIDEVDRETLVKLPLWDNFRRWENLVTIGLLYASDISQADPVANAQMKELIDSCNTLYSKMD